MRYLFTIFFLFTHIVFGQDTILIHQSPHGNFAFRISNATDTLEIGYYSKGKMEYTIKRDLSTKNICYTRYYRSGKKMWIKEWKNNTENGKCYYFNTKGINVAEFNYSEGTIKDTLFLAKSTHILFGKLSYSSTIYGGMQREDGTSNVSSSNGPYMNHYMKLIRIDGSKGKDPLEFYFTSDFQGEFMTVLEPGNYGLFPKDFPSKEVEADMFSQKFQPTGSTIENWNINSPIILTKDKQIQYFNFEYSSIGYAP